MMAETGNFALLKKQDGAQIRWYLERMKPEKYGRNQDGGGNNLTFNNFQEIMNTPVPNLSQVLLDRLRARGLIK
jgi:hypothetical protein